MEKFSKKRIAILLASLSVSGSKSSAMNKSETKVESSRSLETVYDNKNLSNKIPAPPINLPKNLKTLYYTLAALGIPITVVLIILGVKFFGKKSDDEGGSPDSKKANEKNKKTNSQNDKKINQEKPKGEVFVVKGTIDEIKEKGKDFFGDNAIIGRCYDDWYKQNLFFGKEALDAYDVKGLDGTRCLIYFDKSSGNFECWEIDKDENLLGKIEISELEKKVIKKHIDFFKDTLGIIPSYVCRFNHSFYFGFDFANGDKFRASPLPLSVLFICKNRGQDFPMILI